MEQHNEWCILNLKNYVIFLVLDLKIERKPFAKGKFFAFGLDVRKTIFVALGIAFSRLEAL